MVFADQMRLPGKFDWDSCVIRVPEAEVRAFPEFLKQISVEQEVLMRQQCLHAFQMYCGAKIAQAIRETYDETL